MSTVILLIVTILVILALILMGYHSVSVFRRAVETVPYYKKKIELKSEIDVLKKKIIRAHQEISDLGVTLKEMRADIVKGEHLIGEAAVAKKWLEDHKNELAAKNAAIAKLKEEIKKLKDEYNDIDEKFKDKLKDLREQVQGLSDQLRQSQKDLDGLNKEIELANKAKAEADKARDKAETDKATAETAAADAKKAAAVAKEEQKSAEKSRQEAEERRMQEEQKLVATMMANTKAEAEKTRLEAENKRLEEAIKEARQAETDANADKLVAEIARDEAEIARRAAEEAKMQAESSRQDAERAREKEETTLNKVRAERVLNEEVRDAAKKEIENMQLPDKRAEKGSLDDAIAKLRTELSTLKDEKEKRQQLDEDVRNLENRKAQLEGEVAAKGDEATVKQGEVNGLVSKRDGLLSEIARLEGILKPLTGQSIDASEKMKLCWEDLNNAMPNIIKKGKHSQENKWLAEFKSNLEAAKIIFPERTLLAFHTSMKVQDYSPMAVLAGISGTGKSLLPELYAHAIGMNFLQVAVQPRWDSPQDLLGFYNYMEYRFKATELSRLLWQSDFYNNKDWAHYSMNLVLLDEMNLARVEYYFSDMLSKLEVRRGINPDNEVERQAAEIELECCAGLPRRRLFVGANTLFVGTMNEDESTQSLSDKVLDRSNVIRFGKPSKLNVKPDKQAFLKACVKDGPVMMTLPDWQSWLCHDGGGVAEKLVGALQKINNELMEIRRPFGHRVWQSIQAYVENYPGGTDVRSDAFRHALADQIEMKILPKLNGVDKQDSKTSNVLTSILGIVSEETKDAELEKTLGEAVNDTSNAFFQWKGVSR